MNGRRMTSLVTLVIGVVCLVSVRSELFTAVVDLEKLLNTEKRLIRTLDAYLTAEEERLTKLRLLRDNYVDMQTAANQDIKSYLANPVNAYLLVKRLTTDWKSAENLVTAVSADNGKAVFENISNNTGQDTFPSAEDLSGAASALLRLQDTYKLDTSSLARGIIPVRDTRDNVTQSRLELTAGDCFELGRQSYVNGDHYHTVLWMQEALDRLGQETRHIKTADKTEILEYLAFSTYHQGNVRHALRLTEALLEVAPGHVRATGNMLFYEDAIKKSKTAKKRGDEGEDVPLDDFISESTTSPSSRPKEETEREIYESLCRGEKRLTPQTEAGLTCYYLDTRQKPYLRLMKLQVEVAFNKPLIVVFRNVLTLTETDVVVKLAQPRLKRATVQNYKTGELEVASYRISKSAWLKNSDHDIVAQISQKIEDITGLTTSTAEELQVVNYGIGGHYEPHYDFARKEEKNAFKSLGTGNRIATWLNYMTDVEAGGATVFPLLGITLWPERGSAAFWYNLHRNGEGDLLTRHAACPVLVGSKWVSNKWFHERGQEFRRPCATRING